jgi:SAM-dependent methyltransferase
VCLHNIYLCIPDIAADLGITSILDCGCGSMVWMAKILTDIEASRASLSVPFITYHGVDIVPGIVTAAREVGAAVDHEGAWTFSHGDLTHFSFLDTLSRDLQPMDSAHHDVQKPEILQTETSFDLIIVRDVFFHLSFQRIQCALNNLSLLAMRRQTDASERGQVAPVTHLLATSNNDTYPYTAKSYTDTLKMGGYRCGIL